MPNLFLFFLKFMSLFFFGQNFGLCFVPLLGDFRPPNPSLQSEGGGGGFSHWWRRRRRVRRTHVSWIWNDISSSTSSSFPSSALLHFKGRGWVDKAGLGNISPSNVTNPKLLHYSSKGKQRGGFLTFYTFHLSSPIPLGLPLSTRLQFLLLFSPPPFRFYYSRRRRRRREDLWESGSRRIRKEKRRFIKGRDWIYRFFSSFPLSLASFLSFRLDLE